MALSNGFLEELLYEDESTQCSIQCMAMFHEFQERCITYGPCRG